MTKMSEMSDRMRENVAKQGFYMPLNPSHKVWGLLGPSLGSTCNKKWKSPKLENGGALGEFF